MKIKGGELMGFAFANGLRAVNSGEIVTLDIPDPFNESKPLVVEVMRPEQFNRDCQIIAYYYWDYEAGRKVEITVYRRLMDRQEGSEVYLFKDKGETHFYWSRHYPNYIGMPKKYYDVVKYLHGAFLRIFG